jgi:hypothetical protein
MRPSLLAVAAAVIMAALPAAAQQAPIPAKDAPAKAAPAKDASGKDASGKDAPAPQGLPGMDQLMKYIATPGYFKAVSTVALGGEHDINPGCKAKVLGRAGFTVLALPEWQDGKDAPVGGAWKDQLAVDRCGSQVLHNVLVEATKDGAHVGLLMPGETGAPVAMQAGVVQAVAEVALKASGCKDPSKFIPVDTTKHELLEPMKADDKGRLITGKWDEVWTTRACGKTEPVLVTFTADGKGSADYAAARYTEKKAAKKK